MVYLCLSAGEKTILIMEMALLCVLCHWFFIWVKIFRSVKKNKITEEVTRITHAHPRSILGSYVYIELLQNLFANMDKKLAYEEMQNYIRKNYSDYPFKDELQYYNNILEGNLYELKESNIKSSGYVVDTLEASIWAFFNHEFI